MDSGVNQGSPIDCLLALKKAPGFDKWKSTLCTEKADLLDEKIKLYQNSKEELYKYGDVLTEVKNFSRCALKSQLIFYQNLKKGNSFPIISANQFCYVRKMLLIGLLALPKDAKIPFIDELKPHVIELIDNLVSSGFNAGQIDKAAIDGLIEFTSKSLASMDDCFEDLVQEQKQKKEKPAREEAAAKAKRAAKKAAVKEEAAAKRAAKKVAVKRDFDNNIAQTEAKIKELDLMREKKVQKLAVLKKRFAEWLNQNN